MLTFKPGDGRWQNHFTWETRTATVMSGQEVLFEKKGVKVPAAWSQQATDILASKFLWKGENAEDGLDESVDRMTQCWGFWGVKLGLFSEEQRAHFEHWVARSIVSQQAAPNSPQWFNTGVHYAYAIRGEPQGHWYVEELDDGKPELVQSSSAYERPQPHACFILSVNDDLVNQGGIMDLWVREARIFKFGSGVGTNFSNIRSKGEPLNNGGVSGGLMPWLKIGDAAAGAIKSGGTTRKAAKMVLLDISHPEVEDFIQWKQREERKVQCLVTGWGELVNESEDFAKQCQIIGLSLGYDFNGEAYQTVSGQNSNNSVRVPAAFMKAIPGGNWKLRRITDPTQFTEVPAGKLWITLCQAAWACADPGLHFSTTIDEWHTCPNGGPIRASNPCSEYMFLDDTACNLASLNLTRFVNTNRRFMIEEFVEAVRLWTIVLEISVGMAQFPSREIALKSWEYRTLGLGYTGLGTMLMMMGIPYASAEARAVAGAITALMTGVAYETSAEMAEVVGPFPKFEENKEHMLRVIRNHARAAGALTSDYEGLTITPVGVDHNTLSGMSGTRMGALAQTVKTVWGRVLSAKKFRNAQTTVIAPTGTISFVMDSGTTGIEPLFALVATKKLAMGGSMKIEAKGVSEGAEALGYSPEEAKKIADWVVTTGSIAGCPHLRIEKQDDILFATAVPCGKGPVLGWLDHLMMMAAVQPFISGAISKTVNMPENATVADVSNCFITGYKLGLKALAIYRDNSKMSQPLSVTKKETKPEIVTLEPKKLPKTRAALTHKFSISGQTGFVTVGLYEDGQPGELFLRMSKAGSTLSGLCEALGRAISIALQHHVPLERLIKTFTGQKFEPAGPTDNADVKFARSIVDYVFRWMEKEFILKSQSDAFEKPTEKTGEVCTCGSLMTKAGTCYSCPACGNSTGCG